MTDNTATAAQDFVVAELLAASAADTPLRLVTGETSWPDADIGAVHAGWVTIRYTVWKGSAGYSQLARLRTDAITAYLYPISE